MTDNWALKAIEREAMNRARQDIITNPDSVLRIYGLTLREIGLLRRFYSNHTGKRPEDIIEADLNG